MISLKKLGVVGIAAALSLSFAACSKGGGAQATSNSTAASSGLVEAVSTAAKRAPSMSASMGRKIRPKKARKKAAIFRQIGRAHV